MFDYGNKGFLTKKEEKNFILENTKEKIREEEQINEDSDLNKEIFYFLSNNKETLTSKDLKNCSSKLLINENEVQEMIYYFKDKDELTYSDFVKILKCCKKIIK